MMLCVVVIVNSNDSRCLFQGPPGPPGEDGHQGKDGPKVSRTKSVVSIHKWMLVLQKIIVFVFSCVRVIQVTVEQWEKVENGAMWASLDPRDLLEILVKKAFRWVTGERCDVLL